MVSGSRPAFIVGAEKTQDTLTLQFTTAGGLPATKLLAGRHAELRLTPDAGRSRGEFAFRLGPAAAHAYATGTWDYYRELPDGALVGLARLVSRRRACNYRHALQLMVKTQKPISMDVPEARQPLACVHFGWAADVSGRRVAAIADYSDPGFARLVTLPRSIEVDLQRSAELDADRATRRDGMVAIIKQHEFPELPDNLAAEVAAIRRLPAQHVAQQRLYRLSYGLSDVGVEIPMLTAWRKEDRKRWQQAYATARRARNRRREQWLQLARELVRSYEAICIEPLDLAEAAVTVDEDTGERSEFSSAARRGRVVAGLYELRSAIAWYCTKTATPLIELTGPTVSTCAYCDEGSPVARGELKRELHCPSCGAVTDRKLHGAARAYQLVEPQRDRLVCEFAQQWSGAIESAGQLRAEKQARMIAGRRKAAEDRRRSESA